MRVDYPVAIDNDYAIWHAFDNHYWPALYLIDAKGRIRHHQFGEGDYEQSEGIIQQLLTEAGVGGIGQDLVSVDAAGRRSCRRLGQFEVTGELRRLRAHRELRVARRRAYRASATSMRPGAVETQSLGPFGRLDDGERSLVLNQANGRIAYRFHARDLHLVMGPAATERPCDFACASTESRRALRTAVDVDDQGNGTVSEQRLYQLIRQPKPIADRQFEIEFLAPGVEAFAFTFG